MKARCQSASLMTASRCPPDLSSASEKTRPICGLSPMTLKNGAVTTKPETRSGPRPSTSLRLNDSRRPTASASKTVLSVFQSRKFCHEMEMSGCPGDDSLRVTMRSGVRVRQRAEEDGVDDAEDGGVGADAEREGEDGHEREAGRFAELAESEAEVVHGFSEGGFATRPAGLQTRPPLRVTFEFIRCAGRRLGSLGKRGARGGGRPGERWRRGRARVRRR